MENKVLYDHDLTREMVPNIFDGHAKIKNFVFTLPYKISTQSELIKNTNSFTGNLRSVKEARDALFIIFRYLNNELAFLEEEPEVQNRVAEILEYLREHLPATSDVEK
jgi:hypothetical protein